MTRILIDPGHGGTDQGATHYDIREADLNLDISKKLEFELARNGYTVSSTRMGNEAVRLIERCDMANLWPADLFVSIHCNAFTDPRAHGFEVIHHAASEPGRMLAVALSVRIKRNIPGLFERGHKDDVRGLAVLRKTRMPAVLVECGFMSNPDDLEIIRSERGQLLFAQAIAEGIELAGYEKRFPHGNA